MGIIYNCGNHYSAAGECWSPCWSHCFIYIGKLVALLVALYGQLTSHFTLHFSVCRQGPREICVGDFEVMLYNVQNSSVQQDNEDEALGCEYPVMIEAEDMDLDPAITHWAVRQAPVLIVGASGVLSAEVMSMAAATGPIPGPEEVIMKKATLVTVQKQMAALVRGEDLPASQPGAREVQNVPYVVPTVGGEDTKCPICHLVFMTPY